MYIEYNPHPDRSNTGDCVIRALMLATGIDDWDSMYLELMLEGFVLKNWPDYNGVWGAYLLRHGFKRYSLPNNCPDCYTVRQFCQDHRNGTFVLSTGTHVVTAIDGDYYDSWDSGNEIPTHVYVKEETR